MLETQTASVPSHRDALFCLAHPKSTMRLARISRVHCVGTPCLEARCKHLDRGNALIQPTQPKISGSHTWVLFYFSTAGSRTFIRILPTASSLHLTTRVVGVSYASISKPDANSSVPPSHKPPSRPFLLRGFIRPQEVIRSSSHPLALFSWFLQSNQLSWFELNRLQIRHLQRKNLRSTNPP